MKKSERLQIIIDLYIQQENKALEALGICQQKQQALIQQRQNLQSYRQEYNDKYAELGRRKLTVNQLMEFHAFVNKLDNAIEIQQQTIEASQIELAQYRQSWEQKHQKTQSLKKVTEKAIAEELKRENKREQAEQDDRAARSGKRVGTGSA